MTTLANLRKGEAGYVVEVNAKGALRIRLEEMGLADGCPVRSLYKGGTGMHTFLVAGSVVALRREEAEKVKISPAPPAEGESNDAIPNMGDFNKNGGEEAKESSNRPGGADAPALSSDYSSGACSLCRTLSAHKPHCSCNAGEYREAEADELTVAIVGNPNCGKTAFFNSASGRHEHTGNYAGVTITCVTGQAEAGGRRIRVVDLPGTYSLHAYSPDEAYVLRELAKGSVDVVVNVINAANPERHLLLTLQLQKLGLPVVVACNMMDELQAEGSTLHLDRLAERLDMPCLPMVARKGEGVKEVLEKAVELAETRHVSKAKQEGETGSRLSRDSTTSLYYTRIRNLLQGVFMQKAGHVSHATHLLDHFLLRGPGAYLAFLAVMWIVFYLTFTLGAYPMDWIDAGIGWLGEQLGTAMPEGWFRGLLVDGILGGVGSVIVFLPNILILYFLISLLEDSGYLARAAVLADPLLRRVGLHGKSFIPLLMGFGCNVPAIMATRTIEQRKARLITIVTLPLMSCSARLPVYIVFTGAFFPSHAAEVMLLLYLGGIVLALAVAGVMNAVYHRGETTSFVVELPFYRRPMWQSIVRHTWEKGREYLHKMATVILVASIAIWALGYFPKGDGSLSPAQQQEQSYLGRLGKALQPALSPLGFDNRMSVGVVAGLGAKELMVGTLGVLYNCDEDDAAVETTEEAAGTRLSQALRASTTPEAALSYLVFALIYFPCMAAIAAVRGESGRWKTAIFVAGYTTVLAYLIAWGTYRIALLF